MPFSTSSLCCWRHSCVGCSILGAVSDDPESNNNLLLTLVDVSVLQGIMNCEYWRTYWIIASNLNNTKVVNKICSHSTVSGVNFVLPS